MKVGKKILSQYAALMCSLLVFFAAWHIAALYVRSELVLPKPLGVFIRLYTLSTEAAFWRQLGTTLSRSVVSFALSLCISLALGLLIGLYKPASLFFRLPLTVIKATPVVSFILLALYWFSTSNVPIFVSILMTLPVMTMSVASGIQNTDKKLLSMAIVYGFTFKQKIKGIYIPSMLPYFFSGSLSSLGLTWKVVVASEILSLPKNSVGSALQTAKVHLETVDVFAWTIAVIILSYCGEWAFAAYTKKWRYAGGS